jgi:hypothetical protein
MCAPQIEKNKPSQLGCLSTATANQDIQMNRLSNADRSRVVACIVEGNSIRATVRITPEAHRAWIATGLPIELLAHSDLRSTVTYDHCCGIQLDLA